jgi:hypothetical protein
LSAVEQMDLAAFYGAYRLDGHGRPAHDPAMMVALLLYAEGVAQSRFGKDKQPKPRNPHICGGFGE